MHTILDLDLVFFLFHPSIGPKRKVDRWIHTLENLRLPVSSTVSSTIWFTSPVARHEASAAGWATGRHWIVPADV